MQKIAKISVKDIAGKGLYNKKLKKYFSGADIKESEIAYFEIVKKKKIKRKKETKELKSLITGIQQDLIDNNLTFRDLLIGDDLEKIIASIDYNKYSVNEQKLLNKYFSSELFSYTSFRASHSEIIFELHDIDVCPYCNEFRTYTISKSSNNKGRQIFQFDHYYDKSTHPYLYINFYNLIPSCSYCNHIKETSSIDTLIYDHNISDNIEFEAIPQDVDFFLIRNRSKPESVKIDMSKKDIAKLHSDIEAKIDEYVDQDYFKLKKRYKNYSKEILDIYTKNQIYNLSSIISISKIMKFTPKDVLRLVYDTEVDSEYIKTRPLSKLKSDVLKELDDFKYI